MIKINNECVSNGEALVHSDGLTKHSVLVMWTILEMKKMCPLPPKSKNVRIRVFTHSNMILLLHNQMFS